MNRAFAHGVIFICCLAHVVQGDEGAGSLPSPGSNGDSMAASAPPVGQALVTHARGAVTLQIPAPWSVLELPLNRQIRLLMSPEPLEHGANFRRGVWLSLYYHEHIERLSDPELTERAQAVLRSHYPELEAVKTATFQKLDAFRSVRLDFTLPRRRPDRLRYKAQKIPTDVDLPSGRGVEIAFLPSQVGFYFLVQMDWGLCELCGITLAPDQGELNELLRIASGIRLRQPTAPRWEPTAATEDAFKIFGSWKAAKSRLRIQPNAEIVIVADESFQFTSQDEDEPRTGNEITGGYVADDDVLLVTWLDGSKLNYRWRLLGNRLLLTDHKGRTTRLLRILE